LQDHPNQSRVKRQPPKLKAIQTANGKGQMANGLGFEKSANCKPFEFWVVGQFDVEATLRRHLAR
jgi:hypothetical protein